MKQVFITTAFAIASAALVFGCGSETTGPGSETGSVGLNIVIDGTDVKSVAFEVVCDSGITLTGNLNVNDENDPPIAATVMDLPPGPCSVELIASDEQGVPLCTGSTDFTVVANTTVNANVVLVCGDEPDPDPLGNVLITGTFEFIDTNRCPRLHFLNAVPDEVPAGGSEVTVLVSDADGDTLTTALTATSGSFGDPGATSTTYTCDLGGTQTIFVTVSDGDAECDKSKSFDVTCPATGNPCEGVECPDTGNQCTVGICTDQSAPDCVETNVQDGLACDAGGITDLADNGGLEEGSFNGWLTDFCDGTSPDSRGLCELTDMAATGDFAVRQFNDQPASASVLKQANKGIGIVQPGDTVTITFAAKGAGVLGGVAFAEFFSEIDGGGTSASVLLGNAPLLLTDQYQPFSFTVTAGPNVSGGVTLQFAAVTGGDVGSAMELFVDDVAITVEGGGAGTCQEGVCEPVVIDLCEGVTCDDTGNDCTVAECNPANGQCEVSNVADGTVCDNDTGTCDAGVCAPSSEKLYNQDFETLDSQSATALSGDGWLASGNLFDGTGAFVGNFGVFGAPNATSDPGNLFYSGVIQGQGGPAQGNQQLIVFNDYNCCGTSEGHRDTDGTNGFDTVEALVFREPFPLPVGIPQDRVGQTVTFFFEGKADPGEFGLGGSTTAQAFVKVLDQDNGFPELAKQTVDTTALPADWAGFSVSLDITQALGGKLLQIGFQTVAQQGEPSTNIYDNTMISFSPTP